MDVREKIVEILKQAPFEGKVLDEWWLEEKIKRIADHLIANGVIVLPCKVGTAVYIPEIEVDKIERKVVTKIYRTTVDEYSVNARYIMYHTRKGNNFTDSMVGKTVFLTREEAEKALEENK